MQPDTQVDEKRLAAKIDAKEQDMVTKGALAPSEARSVASMLLARNFLREQTFLCVPSESRTPDAMSSNGLPVMDCRRVMIPRHPKAMVDRKPLVSGG